MAGFNPELALAYPFHRPGFSYLNNKIHPANSPLTVASRSSSQASEISKTGQPIKDQYNAFPPRKSSLPINRPSAETNSSPPSASVHTTTASLRKTPSTSLMASQPPATQTSAQLARQRSMSLRPRTSFRFFGHFASEDTPAAAKPKRKRLVRKRLSEPTFDMVTPSRGGPGEGADSGQRDGSSPGTSSKTIRDNTDTARNTSETFKDCGGKKASNMNITVSKGNSPVKKRWSRPPLLPELDFGSTSSGSPLLEAVSREVNPSTNPTVSIKPSTTATLPLNPSDPSKLTYRCDVHAANSASHLVIERACRDLVKEAGGSILESHFYAGGFLYSLPPGIVDPIATCEIAAREAKVEVGRWLPLPEPRLNGLRMHPPFGKLGSERTAPRDKVAEELSKRHVWADNQVEKWIEGSNAGQAKMDITVENQSNSRSHAQPVNSPKVGSERLKQDPTKSTLLSGRSTLISAKSIGQLRCHGSGGTSSENVVSPQKSVATPQSASSHRFTVVCDLSESDEDLNDNTYDDERDEDSGDEEWESVRSELDE